MRIYRLLKELNIELEVLQSILNVLDYEERDLSIFSAIPNNIAILVKGLYSEEIEFFKLIEIAAKKWVYNPQSNSNFSLKTVGYINLDVHKSHQYNIDENRLKNNK